MKGRRWGPRLEGVGSGLVVEEDGPPEIVGGGTGPGVTPSVVERFYGDICKVGDVFFESHF